MKNKLQEFSVEISTNRNYKQEISGLMVELGLKDSEIATQRKNGELGGAEESKYKGLWKKEADQVNYYKNLAERHKGHLDRALEDLEFYRKVLKKGKD